MTGASKELDHIIEFANNHGYTGGDPELRSLITQQLNTAVVEARIDEVENAYNVIQYLLIENDDDSDEASGLFQVEARKRIATLKQQLKKK